MLLARFRELSARQRVALQLRRGSQPLGEAVGGSLALARTQHAAAEQLGDGGEPGLAQSTVARRGRSLARCFQLRFY